MFIELTDHLRCPADHDEAFLVLIPDLVERRSVRTGTLGCPVCDRRYTITDGTAEFGDVGRVADTPNGGEAELAADALQALIGLSGPGGYAMLVGGVAAQWRELAALVSGVAFVAVNPPASIADEAPVLSALRSARLPLKTRSMRGVVLGPGYGDAEAWVAEARRIVLPGLRVVGHGPAPTAPGLDVLASAGGWWVAVVGV